MSKYKCIIFDLDGTILDTSAGIRRSIEESIRILKLPEMTNAQLESCIGPPIQNSFKNIYHMEMEEATAAAAVFRNLYKEKYLCDAVVYDGMLEVFKHLKKCGMKIMIATYKREDYTLTLLEKFGLLDIFDYVKGSDFEGKLSKADIIRLCIEQGGCSDEEVVMIGDTTHDSKAAQEMEIDFVAVTYGFGFKPLELIEEAVYIANTAEEIKEFLCDK